MPLTVFFTKGLPASGKSTWAKEQIEKLGHGNVIYINNDSMQKCFCQGKFLKGFRDALIETEECWIDYAIENNKHVIVDNTHLNPEHEKRIRELLKQYTHVEFKIIDFTNVDIETCIERDKNRNEEDSVGEKVIRNMYNKWLKPQQYRAEPIQWDNNKPYCIIVDLDGTLAINDGHRSFFEYETCDKDKPNRSVILTIRAMKEYFKIPSLNIFLFSGREESARESTCKFLSKYSIPFNQLEFRANGDYRKDDIVKKEMFDKYIKDKYNVVAVFDDRDCVVRLWRSLGLPTFQVADGNF